MPTYARSNAGNFSSDDRVNLIRRIWHDPVWSKVIAAAIVSAGVAAWSLRGWIFADIDVSRSQVVVWFLAGLLLGVAIGVRMVYDLTRRTVAVNASAPTVLPPAAAPAVTERPESVLEPADWNVLYAMSQRPDPERVTRFEIPASTGLGPMLRVTGFRPTESSSSTAATTPGISCTGCYRRDAGRR
jgi:hypothetical protein